jgi:hypothetical protein
VADRTGESVGGISRWVTWQLEQTSHHHLNLFLACLAVTHYRLLDLQSGVLVDWKVANSQCCNRCATGLAERKGCLRVDVDEHDFDRREVGLPLLDHLGHTNMDRAKARGQIAIRHPDHAACQIRERARLLFDDAKARAPQARVNSEDAHAAGPRQISVPEVADASEDHCDAPLIGRSDHLVITH